MLLLPRITSNCDLCTPTLPSPASVEKQIISVWFNAGLGNALKATELNIEDFHQDQDTYLVEMILVPEGLMMTVSWRPGSGFRVGSRKEEPTDIQL